MTTALYKGKKYRLDWKGQTKYGKRAKLSFFNGSKSFWVDLNKVTIQEEEAKGEHCAECGRFTSSPIECYDIYDNNMVVPLCYRCSRLQDYEQC